MLPDPWNPACSLNCFRCLVARGFAHVVPISLLAGLHGGAELILLASDRGPASLHRISSRIAQIVGAPPQIFLAFIGLAEKKVARLRARLGCKQQAHRYSQSQSQKEIRELAVVLHFFPFLSSSVPTYLLQ